MPGVNDCTPTTVDLMSWVLQRHRFWILLEQKLVGKRTSMEPNCGIRIHHGGFSKYCPVVRWMLRYCGQAANLSRLEVWRFGLYVVTVRIVNAVVITTY